MDQNNNSPDYVTQRGEEIYLNELRSELEANHFGEYAVIEVNTKKHFIDQDLTVALKDAEVAFPNTLFYIVKIGTLQNLQKMVRHDWLHRKQPHLR